MNKYQKGFAPIIVALIVLILAGAGETGYYLMNKQSQKQTACTMDAKICLDGSSVGRTGPNCEFAACPEVKIDETVDWKTYTDNRHGYEIKYPPLYDATELNTRVGGVDIGNKVITAYGIYYEQNKNKTSSLEKLKSSMEESLKDSAPVNLKITWKDTIVSNEKAIEMSYESFAGGYTGIVHETAVIKNNIGYIINMNYGGSEKEYYKILSTFKFLDLAQNQDLKTYINSKYNYQISYSGDTYTIENITSDPKKSMTDDHVTLYDIKSVQKTKECECGEYSAIYINSYPNPQGLSLKEYVKQNIDYWFDGTDYSNLLINEVTSLNGVTAIKIGMEREQYYVLEKNNTVFSIGGYMDMGVINTFNLK